MARASTETLLSLDEFAEILGLDPFSLNQFGEGFPNPPSHSCANVFYQYEWQQDYLSREELGRAIYRAEELLAQQLGYYPAPKYIAGESVQYVKSHHAWHDANYQWKAVQTRYQRVLGGGVRARTLLGTVNVTYSDPDGDGVDELFTTAAQLTTITDTSEIGIYFKSTDRSGVPVDETWRIRPVTVTIAGGSAIITGHASMLGLPILSSGYNVAALDVTDAANYVTQVEVYRVYRDTSDSGNAYWEAGDCTTEPCTLEERALTCLGDRNGDYGLVFTSYDYTDCWNWRGPDKLTLNYLAGIPRISYQDRMQQEFAQMTAYLAVGLTADLSCGCERSDRILGYWREDLSRSESTPANSRSGTFITPHQTNSAFGYTRGGLFAWDRVSELRQYMGLSV